MFFFQNNYLCIRQFVSFLYFHIRLPFEDKKIPVIMFSSLTQRGATATLDALSLGASDYVAKPANVGSVSIAMQRVKEVLIPKIKALCSKKMTLSPCIPPVVPPPAKAGFERYAATAEKPDISHLKTTPTIQRRVDILAIGVSTGGPTALADFLPTLPKNLPTPMVVVQHMPPFFTQLLATRLDSKSEISIGEGAPGKILEPGHAWIAPGDFHMVLEKNV